jgi:glycosyltransferase involved in cell wall biosynthesis
MNLGIVTPRLCGYGGSEIYLLECLKRWQQVLNITVYSPEFNPARFEEFGIDPERVVVKTLDRVPAAGGRFRLLHETVVQARLWERQIGYHDVYFLYLFPTQMIRRRPSVWFASEPMRMLDDLRHVTSVRDRSVDVPCRSERNLDRPQVSDLDVVLQIVEQMDQMAPFDRLATNSRSTGRVLENIYGRAPDLVAYPGITVRGAYTPPSSFDRVLYIGRLWRHRRVDVILEAMARLDPRRQLTIVGDGPERSCLERLAVELGLEDSVRFTGEVSMDERDRLVQECACCVYAPERESFGLTPLEAAAAGRPVVATHGGAYSEILTENAACVVPPDEAAIAAAIHRILVDPERAVRMGRAARKLVEPFTWDRTAESLLELLCTTARRGGRVRGAATGVDPELEKLRVAPPELGAHYFPWYRAGKHPAHWNENPEFAGVTDWPIGGPYSSGCESVIRRHVELSLESGLDFFVVHWQVGSEGPDPIEVEATDNLFRIVEEEGVRLKLALRLDLDVENPDVTLDAIETARRRYIERPCYHRHDGKPMLWYYLNRSLLGFLYQRYRALERLNRAVHPIATSELAYQRSMPRLVRSFFQGWCLHSPLEVSAISTWDPVWRESYRDFEEDGGAIRAFTICPGYDDGHLDAADGEANRQRSVPRMGLKTYEHMQEVALGLEPVPHYVVVTSFNAFHENTHIEPSVQYGDAYLKSTRAFKERLASGS